jgi:hemoglobin
MTLKEAAARIERVDESSTIYDVIGEEGIMRMVAAFYRRVPEDDVLGPMYPPDDLAGAEQRLRDFLIYRLGGPERYIVERGHPRLRMRHMPFAINQLARDRWVTTMAAAMREADLPEEVLRALQSFFEQIATFLINSPD